jgi:DNA-binding response OmpR family regulator
MPIPKQSLGKVLIIDDQPELRQLFRRVLENHGCTVETAENGQVGLEAVETMQPDLVLLDMAMPLMDGVAFLRALRDRPRWKSLPVIILSGLMSPQQVVAARELGVADLLVKAEFSMKELRTRVASLLTASMILSPPVVTSEVAQLSAVAVQ